MRGGFNSVEPSVVYSVLSECGGNSIAAAKFISDQHAEAFVGSSSSPALPSAGEGYNANFPALPSIPRKERAGNTNKLQARRSRPSPLPLPSIGSRGSPIRNRRSTVGYDENEDDDAYEASLVAYCSKAAENPPSEAEENDESSDEGDPSSSSSGDESLAWDESSDEGAPSSSSSGDESLASPKRPRRNSGKKRSSTKRKRNSSPSPCARRDGDNESSAFHTNVNVLVPLTNSSLINSPSNTKSKSKSKSKGKGKGKGKLKKAED